MTALYQLRAAEKTPFVVHCGACGHQWLIAYLPMEVGALFRIVRGSACPSCGQDSRRIYCGPRRAPIAA
jgi:hypothetical protein